MIGKIILVGSFLFSTVAFSYHDSCCCVVKFKVKKYTQKLVDAADSKDACFDEAKETGDKYATCYWHVKRESYFFDKLEKWTEKLNECEE